MNAKTKWTTAFLVTFGLMAIALPVLAVARTSAGGEHPSHTSSIASHLQDVRASPVSTLDSDSAVHRAASGHDLTLATSSDSDSRVSWQIVKIGVMALTLAMCFVRWVTDPDDLTASASRTGTCP